MKIKLITLILIGFYLVSCKNSLLEKDLQNIWVGKYQQTIYFDDTSNNKFFLPELIDLRDPKKAVLKYFGGNIIETTWDIQDSIITILEFDT